MKAGDIMSKDPIVLNKSKTVKEAAQLMVDKNISVLPVVDDGDHLVGIITQGDFVGKNVNVHYVTIMD